MPRTPESPKGPDRSPGHEPTKRRAIICANCGGNAGQFVYDELNDRYEHAYACLTMARTSQAARGARRFAMRPPAPAEEPPI